MHSLQKNGWMNAFIAIDHPRPDVLTTIFCLKTIRIGDSNMLATSYQLMNAIRSNSIIELNEFIELGGDVNTKCNFPYGLMSSERGNTVGHETKFSSTSNYGSVNIPVLHQAVRACYDRVHGGPRRDQAFAVLQKLLESGADPKINISGCYVCNIEGSSAMWGTFSNGTALEFADFLLQYNIDKCTISYCDGQS